MRAPIVVAAVCGLAAISNCLPATGQPSAALGAAAPPGPTASVLAPPRDTSGQPAGVRPSGDAAPDVDWAGLKRYQSANAALPPPTAGQPRVVFMGDSITQN